MSILTINGVPTDVDIREELEQYEWDRPTWHADRLTAASPFETTGLLVFTFIMKIPKTQRPAISGTAAQANAAASLNCLRFCVKKPKKKRFCTSSRPMVLAKVKNA